MLVWSLRSLTFPLQTFYRTSVLQGWYFLFQGRSSGCWFLPTQTLAWVHHAVHQAHQSSHLTLNCNKTFDLVRRMCLSRSKGLKCQFQSLSPLAFLTWVVNLFPILRSCTHPYNLSLSQSIRLMILNFMSFHSFKVDSFSAVFTQNCHIFQPQLLYVTCWFAINCSLN